MPGIQVVAAAARSGKTARLVARYRQVLADEGPGTALWLAPTQRAAALVREAVVLDGLAGCLNPNCLTFDQFAQRLLDASRLVVRSIGLVDQRGLLARLIAEAVDAGRLAHFQPIADTRGFLDLVVGWVQELKRLEIWPEELLAAGSARSQGKDRELGQLYRDYQRVLNEHQLYDPQGRFWSARAQLRAGQTRPFEAVRHVFVDGFVDFTRTEHEILQIFGERGLSLSLSLPLEIDSPRTELFAKSAATLAELQRRHQRVAIEPLPPRSHALPSLNHIERSLFASPRDVGPPPDSRGVEIVAAAGVTHEVELLARRIKKLLVEGDAAGGCATVRPADVLVVFRALDESTTELVREVFQAYGIPTAIGSRPTLDRAPSVRALLRWLRLDAEDWPSRQLLALLVSDCFRPAWPEAREGRAALALETIVRRRQQPSGRASLVEHVERLAARAAAGEEDPARARDKLSGPARQALPLLNRIAAAIDALPERATHRQWGVALNRLALDTGLRQKAESTDDESRQADTSAWDKLLEMLAQSERMATWLEGAPAQLSRRQLLSYLEDALRSTPWESTSDEAGRVRVLGAEGARHVTAPYVFAAGLSEMSFPPAQRDDCIYSDAETRELAAAGLPLVSRVDRRRHEMLLFYQVVTRPTRQLVLSYPALDESAQPMTPSPYLAELARLFGPEFLKDAARPDLRVVPPSDEVYSADDLRMRATAQALEGEPRLFGRLAHHTSTSAVAVNVLSGLQLVNRRAGAEFGSFEGLLSSDAAHAVLRRRYGPDHCWSTSQLEQYAYCPYQFFIERVLGLRAIEDPVLSVDYQQRGRMLHWLLAELHRRLNVQHGLRTTPSELPGEALEQLMAALLDEVAERAGGGGPLAEGLLQVDLHRVTRSLAGYWQQHVHYDSGTNSWDEPLRPAHFEVAFGQQPGGDAAFDTVDTLSTAEPFCLECDGERVCFSGRIDRIDVGRFADHATFGIIDYKSGRSEDANVNAIIEMAALQLPIYALAAEQLLAPLAARPAHISYWHVAGKGAKQSLKLGEPDDAGLRDSEAWQALRRELPGRIAAYLRGIRQGEFPVICSDDKCTSRCDYHTVCRVNQIRSLDKQWQPPRGQQP